MDGEEGEEQYDEFGNYIGPELDSDTSSSSGNDVSNDDLEMKVDHIDIEEQNEIMETEPKETVEPTTSIVLHEDKKYFLESDEVYPDAEVVMQEEDAQSLGDPIIAPFKEKVFLTKTDTLPETLYSYEYLLSLSKRPNLIRNIAVIGHLHHGKTSFCDLLIQQTLMKTELDNQPRWLDTRQDEQDRELSIKLSATTLALPCSTGKNYLVNIVDTPGHPNFSGEVSAGLRISDGVILVVDAVEGVQLNTRRLLRHAIDCFALGTTKKKKLNIVLVLSKIDRLVHEQKLPPEDAYLKLNYIIQQVNSLLQKTLLEKGSKLKCKFSPKLNNVLFSSAKHRWCFSLKSFAKIYTSKGRMIDVDGDQLANLLWGEVYFNPKTRVFLKLSKKSKAKPPLTHTRAFLHFILNPIYKLYSHIIGEDTKSLRKMLKTLNIKFEPEIFKLDVKPLLKKVLSTFFQDCSCVVESLLEFVPSPKEAAKEIIKNIFLGNSELDKISDCSTHKDSVFAGHVVKLNTYKLAAKKFFANETVSTGNEFLCLARIFNGVLREGDSIEVIGEKYVQGVDEEDKYVAKIKKLFLPLGRHHLPVSHLSAGNWVLIQGIDQYVSSTASLFRTEDREQQPNLGVFKPLSHNTTPVIKLAIEPLNPNELPQLIEALRCVRKSYVLCDTRVEESGEHVIFGTGELFLDCVMKDIREMYSDIEVKVADPCVSFRETVLETSAIKCFAKTSNQKNTISMIAEPLEAGLAEDIESSRINKKQLQGDRKTKKILAKYLEDDYEWDVLAARSIWAFGPEQSVGCTNVLINDIIPSEDESYKFLTSVKQPIVQGFHWATREGPLCDEPIRAVKFKLLNASLASKAVDRGFGQIIPATRRAIYSSFLTGGPKLMEPIFFVETMCTADVLENVEAVLNGRRGNVVKTEAVPGSPFFLIKGTLPVIDSFGFETDLRVHSRGLAFPLQVFDYWNPVPGDPLDTSVILRPLEASRPIDLARDFMVKTRRRKGLGEEVSIKKYFDDEMIKIIEENEDLRDALS